MKKLIHYLLFSLTILHSSASFSQVNYGQRIEATYDEGTFDKTIDMENGKFVSFGKVPYDGYKYSTFKYSLYDTAMTHLATETINIHWKLYNRIGTCHDERYVYTLLFKDSKTVSIIKFDTEEKTLSQFEADAISKKPFKAFLVDNNRKAFVTEKYIAFFGVNKGKVWANLIDKASGKGEQFSYGKGVLPNRANFVGFSNTENELHAFFVKEKDKLYRLSFNVKDKSFKVINLIESDEYEFLSASAVKNENGEDMVVGTYKFKLLDPILGPKNPMEYLAADGVFTCSIENGEKGKNPVFQHFIGMNNYFSYLPNAKKASIHKKVLKYKQNGKKANTDVYMQTKSVLPTSEGIYYLGSGGYINGFKTNEGTNVELYFNHALVLKFSLDGELLWSKTIRTPVNKGEEVSNQNFTTMALDDKGNLDVVIQGPTNVLVQKIDQNGKVLSTKNARTPKGKKFESLQNIRRSTSICRLKSGVFILSGYEKKKLKGFKTETINYLQQFTYSW